MRVWFFGEDQAVHRTLKPATLSKPAIESSTAELVTRQTASRRLPMKDQADFLQEPCLKDVAKKPSESFVRTSHLLLEGRPARPTSLVGRCLKDLVKKILEIPDLPQKTSILAASRLVSVVRRRMLKTYPWASSSSAGRLRQVAAKIDLARSFDGTVSRQSVHEQTGRDLWHRGLSHSHISCQVKPLRRRPASTVERERGSPASGLPRCSDTTRHLLWDCGFVDALSRT